MKIAKKIILAGMLCLVPGGALFSMNAEEKAAIDTFLKAETAEARNQLSSFSDSFLEQFAEEYRQQLSPAEARKTWILEENLKRKADKIAADRLFYVFLSIILLLGLVFGLVWRIFQMQKNLSRLE